MGPESYGGGGHLCCSQQRPWGAVHPLPEKIPQEVKGEEHLGPPEYRSISMNDNGIYSAGGGGRGGAGPAIREVQRSSGWNPIACLKEICNFQSISRWQKKRSFWGCKFSFGCRLETNHEPEQRTHRSFRDPVQGSCFAAAKGSAEHSKGVPAGPFPTALATSACLVLRPPPGSKPHSIQCRGLPCKKPQNGLNEMQAVGQNPVV